jgi:glycosyltransferase involved in cell wall biosynthesis
MLRKAMDANADVVVFIDHDISWRPDDLVRLIQTEGDVVAGTYRFKHDEPEEYMGVLEGEYPIVRDDGCLKARMIPAGFLKITIGAVERFMRAYPELVYGDEARPSVDLFNHGAIEGIWFGEDYAFSKRWNERCGDIWLIPDLNLDHHSKDRVWRGNFHEFLLRQPGGSEAS